MTEAEIVTNLKSTPEKHNAALALIYKDNNFKSSILQFLKSKGVSNTDAQMLWTDIVVKFGLLVRQGKYTHQSKMLPYIKNLSNYILLNYFRDQRKNFSIELKEEIIENSKLKVVSNNHFELKKLLDESLSVIGDSCKNLLLYWAQGYSMKESMQKFNFISVESTRKRKHTCMKKLLRLVDDNKELANLLEEYYYDLKNA